MTLSVVFESCRAYGRLNWKVVIVMVATKITYVDFFFKQIQHFEFVSEIEYESVIHVGS